jgi:glycosyltransferase involved in cell wall biosynthesis
MVSILHLITTLDVGGAETALVRLVSRLDQTRYRCTVVSIGGHGVLSGRLREAGIDVHALSNTRSVGPAALWRLTNLVRRLRPAVLQSWLYHADLLALLVGRLTRVPALAWNIRCSSLDPRHDSRSLFWIRRTLAALSRQPQVVVVNSHAGRAIHEQLGYRPHRWELIPNGIDTAAFAPAPDARREVRAALGVPDTSPLVGLVARFHPMKDHGTFLAAMARVVERRPGVCIVMAGQRVDRQNTQLTGQLSALGLGDRTRLIGETYTPDRIFAALDVSVLSSSYGEGFPNVVAEAMATGVPVVATDVGDAARIVGETGLVVPPRDPASLAAAIGGLLDRPEGERSSLGGAARQRVVREYSLDTVVDRYAAMYTELARSAGARR